VPVEAMSAKIRAATSSRQDADTVILARTDARSAEGMDAAIERALRYVDAGADWIFPEALQSVEEFERFAREVSVPLVANMTEFGKSPLLPFAKIEALGYAAVLYPVTLLRVALKAAEAALGVLAEEGTQDSLLDLMQTRAELYDLLDYEDFDERDRGYFGGAEAPSRSEI
ncbi:MAG TPA: isocitrate lyase/phosphoenolpyruvate mutase family protein, partial [Pirellulaceae bacterium]